MAKKKLNLNYIYDKTIRKRAFRNRKRGFMKKLNDLKILCDVDACAVIYNPFNSMPEVWPSKSGVNKVIEKLSMEIEKKCTLVNHEEFLNLYISKVEKQKQKLFEDNKKNCLKEVMFKCLGGNMGDFVMNDNDRFDLCKFIDQYLKNLYHHKNVTLNNPNFEIGESSSMQMAPTATTANMKTTVVDVGTAPSTIAKSMIPSNQGAEYDDFQTTNIVTNNNQEVYIPTTDQDEFYYPNQNYSENQQQEFIDEMMNYAEQTNFPWMVNNQHYNHNSF